MGRPFQQQRHAEVPASPEQVWEAIATGPGISSWFMGRNEVAGGRVRSAFGGYRAELAVSADEPARRFAYGSPPDGDGRFIAYEFLIEGRAGGSTVLRAVTSGFLPGEDWADEYEAMTLGTDLYFQTLVEYLSNFAGQVATQVTVFRHDESTWDRTRPAILGALGLNDGVTVGDVFHATSETMGKLDGTVYSTNAFTLGLRTDDALLRFIRGFGKGDIAAHLLFAPGVDQQAAEDSWRTWLEDLSP
jgi:uncharacterized protein YndB with AHSA1/START domain